MKKHLYARLLSLLLVTALLAGFALPANAVNSEPSVTWTQVDNSQVSANLLTETTETDTALPQYADTDVVRVSIFLEERSTVEAGFSTKDIAHNAEAMAYRTALQEEQETVTAAIERTLGQELEVVWNLTLAANVISANVPYGKLDAIQAVDGVEQVLLENRYTPDVLEQDETADPNMATSSKQIGSSVAWAAGYTGLGSRVAIIDTGIDTDHQSFNEGAFQYSLAYWAGLSDMSVDEYQEELGLLNAEEIAAVSELLNIEIDADEAYFNTKIPFGYNYIDKDYDITHDNDGQGSHGSHVAGIAAANAYVPNSEGGFSRALSTVMVQGVAPDAQIITMKVFGKNGGAYDSDYMAAIEDAVLLGCDAVNLSLGSNNPGMSRNTSARYQAIMDQLVDSGTVVAMSSGNNGYWAMYARNNSGYLYTDDVSMQASGAPGTYTNSLAVASVDNDGTCGNYITVGDLTAIYSETDYSNKPFTTMAGTYEYILIDGYGTAWDWQDVGDALEGKIALCSRGGWNNFSKKANAAIEEGAIAVFIYNDRDGAFNMDLSGYYYDAPVASLTRADAKAIKDASTVVTTDWGYTYYTGSMTISAGPGVFQYNSEYYKLSDFSSWGVPGSLEMKPEITAPGGSIYSVNGMVSSGDAYEVNSGTSMASPQVAGMAAVVAQYIRENGLEEKTGLDSRTLSQSLLMSTAVPFKDEISETWYPILQQGAGLANVGAAVTADSYILMKEDATKSWKDGKVKVELGDDPDLTGKYTFSFTLNNLTETEKTFELSAAFFTQGTFHFSDSPELMDIWCVDMPVITTWTVDGKALTPSGNMKGLDFNGDGMVNSSDGQAIVDYATGVVTTLSNQDKADLDADGDVDTHDAYRFFQELGSSTAIVASNGSVEVSVTVELTEEWDEHLNKMTNGTYIEGYIFANSVADAEGIEGTKHSIPVLGFYGDWSDASMYEVGSYNEYVTGDETRNPYLANRNANAYTITYADKPDVSYFFGGNPLVADDTYRPERNAINSENGDVIAGVNFTVIRNAAASKFTAVNKTTGESYRETYPGALGSAFFFPAAGSWYNTNYNMELLFTPTDAAEGDVLELELTLATEYHTDAEGNVNWDALGEGATFTMPIVVDNTAPVLEEVYLAMVDNNLTVVASDNQYIAAVALYNMSGTIAFTYTGAKQDIGPNETAEYVLDLDGVNGKRFLLQIFDYAMNTTTYAINMQIGDEVVLPEMIAFDLNKNYWTSFDKNTNYNQLTAYAASTQTFYAATMVDDMILAGTKSGDLYVMPNEDLAALTLVGNMGTVVTDMAYNRADGKVYGVASSRLVSIDKLTGAVTDLGEIGVQTNTLACDANGTFYCNGYGTGTVYSFTLDTIASPAILVEDVGIDTIYIQSMEINPNTGLLCWSSYNIEVVTTWYGEREVPYAWYFEIDPATGNFTRYNDMWNELAALIIPASGSGSGNWTDPTDKVSGVQISVPEVTVLKGTSKELYATVQPWTASDRTVTWTSADPSIAEVDSKGCVSGIQEGVTTITATSNLDPSFSASCTVTVTALDVTVKGMLQDDQGASKFFCWNMKTDNTWTPGNTIDTSMISGTYSPKEDAYYVVDSTDSSWAMHKVGQDGVTITNAGANKTRTPLWDMEYSDYFTEVSGTEMVSSIYNYYLFPPKDPMNMDGSAFALSAYVSYLTAITSLGYEAYYDEGAGITRETEHLILLDNAGRVFNFWIYATETGYSAAFNSYPSDLPCEFEGYDNRTCMYCSMVVGSDGALYLSHFNGKTSELYRMTFNETERMYNAELIATMGQDVWPAILTEVTANTVAGTDAFVAPEATNTIDARPIAAEELAASRVPQGNTAASVFTMTEEIRDAKLNAQPNSESAVAPTEDTVTLNITTDVAATNGLTTVTYDASKLALETAVISGDYSAKLEENGKLTFGYVAMTEIPAEGTIATLTFKVLSAEDSTVTVEHKQVNNTAGATETLTVEFEHKNTEVRDAIEATCTTAGYSGDTWCLDCGRMIAKGEIIQAKGHTFGDWTVTKAATCTKKGEETRTCACGHTETRATNMIGHSYEAVVTEPTCTEMGYTTYTCACGDTYTGDYVNPTGHTFGDWTVTKEATCTEKGEETRACACGETETREISAKGHSYVMETVEPTCTEDGCIRNVCADCGDTQIIVTLPATGHSHEAVVTEPTCTEQGYTTYTCHCGDTYVADYVEALGHSYSEWSVTKQETCTEDGEQVHTCEVCGATETAAIPANCPAEAFEDLVVTEWYHEGVCYVLRNGIMNGMGNGIFAPSKAMTRAELVTTLYRIAGSPSIEGMENPFEDVAETDWFYAAVVWAANEKVVTGTSATTFTPNARITREQIAAILYRFSGAEAVEENHLEGFEDAEAISSYAVEAMNWAVANGIITGMTEDTLVPIGTATRAQIATILMRFCEN